jgi:putative ABC transport system permease protein
MSASAAFETLKRDLRFSLRTLIRNPGFTCIAVLTIALAIGANTAIFSSDHALFFRALPYRDPGRLVELFQKSLPAPSAETMSVAPANYLDWKRDNQSIEAFAAWRERTINLSGGDEPESVEAAQVSANLFSVLGVHPILGRGFRSDEETPGKDTMVVLSYDLWQKRFAGRREVIGKAIRASDRVYTVIGVMPSGFRFPIGWRSDEVDIWTPLALTDFDWSDRKGLSLEVLGRLRGGVSLSEVQASMDAVAQRIAQAYPETNRNWGVYLMPLADRGVRDYRRLFVLLSIAVGLVLLIACANVANLLLARGLERQKELTVRAVLGARRSRLVRQLTTEGVLLALSGGMLGIGIGYGGIRVLASLAPTIEMPELKQIDVNVSVLALSLGLSVLTGFLFSVLPALTLSGAALQPMLRQTGRSSTGTISSHRLKDALLAGEVALTLVLLFCAGDVLNSFFTYMRTDPGFDAHHVLIMHMALPKRKYPDPQQWVTFFERAVEELGGIPGVTGVAAGSGAPMEGSDTVMRFHIAGRPAPSSIDFHFIMGYLRITPEYLRVTGIRLLRGRNLLSSDTPSTPAVALVNETFARQQFGNGNPIGRRIFLDGDVNASAAPETARAPLMIVGVLRDTKEDGLYQITPQMVYVPLAQDPASVVSLLVKTSGPAGGVLAAARRKLARLDPDQPVYSVRTLEEVFQETHAFFRFNTLLLGAFAGIALLLSLIGIYGVAAYRVSQRTREFGIRLALGSPRGGILRLVLRQAAWITLAGFGVGLVLAWPAVRLLTRVLHQSMFLTLVRTGPLLYPVLGLAILLALLCACLIPAWSAMRADPMLVLKYE